MNDIEELNSIQVMGQGDSTYDPINGRYFFSSNDKIVIVDSNNGDIIAVIDNHIRLMGLEYDYSSNKLFGTYSDGGFRTFACYKLSDLSDPPLVDIAELNGVQAVAQGDNTYDVANGRYFVGSGSTILVIDSNNGDILASIDNGINNNSNIRLMGLEYDYSSNKLFGTYSDGGFRTFACYKLSDLSDPPLVDIAELNGVQAVAQGDNTYDVANGRYFVGSGSTILVIDSNNGDILASIDNGINNNSNIRLMGLEYH